MTKELLRRAEEIHRYIALLEQEIRGLQAEQERITSIITGMPRSGKLPDPVAQAAMDAARTAEKLIEILADRKRELDGIRLAIEDFMVDLPMDMQALARERYIMGKSWRQVAYSCGYGSEDSARMTWNRYFDRYFGEE